MTLNLQNKDPSYLCGRLFAVLEKIQLDTSSKDKIKTIRNTYFLSACLNPSVIFPKLIQLSNSNLNKLDFESNIYYQNLIAEIIDKLESTFPSKLNEESQGKFIIGYYHQSKMLFINA